MIRPALKSDQAALEAELLAQVEGAMFPLSNLRTHGLADGFASDHQHATRFWYGQGALGITRGGMVMPCFSPDHAPVFAACLAGQTLTGLIGPAVQVRPLIRALALENAPCRVDEDQPGFELTLDQVRPFDTAGFHLHRPGAQDASLMIEWRTAHHREILGTPMTEAPLFAAKDVEGWLSADSHRLLIQHGQPVAMTGFNARLPEIVQIGGVYTPPELRRRGYARRAVALHLAEARASGTDRAVLFAANDHAASAYRAIGFTPRAAMAFVLFVIPQKVPLCP